MSGAARNAPVFVALTQGGCELARRLAGALPGAAILPPGAAGVLGSV